VGVVGNVLPNLDSPQEPTMYLPLNSGRLEYGSLVAMTGSGHDVSALALPVQKQIAAMDPDLAVSEVLTMEERIGNSIGARQHCLENKKAHRIAPAGIFCSQTYFFASSLRFLAQRALASRESFFLAAKFIVGLVALTVAALLVWGAAPFSA
jgi:hypothetical protein